MANSFLEILGLIRIDGPTSGRIYQVRTRPNFDNKAGFIGSIDVGDNHNCAPAKHTEITRLLYLMRNIAHLQSSNHSFDAYVRNAKDAKTADINHLYVTWTGL